jgi:hypothetical protein
MGRRGLIQLKYVHAFRDRMGRMRYYFRRHGKRDPLPGLPGSSEFMAAYAAQLNKSTSQAKHRPTAAPGTFAALAIRYYGSPQFQSLSATSRTNYHRVIDGFLEQHGHRRRPNDSRACRHRCRQDVRQTGSGHHFAETHPDVDSVRDGPRLDRPRSNCWCEGIQI